MSQEMWKNIQNTTYQVSSLGRVKRADGRIYTPGVGRGGYMHVGLRLAGRRLTLKVHYLVCVTFCEKPIGSECVRHLNGIKTDNRIENLRWGTNKENAADTILHGRQVHGFDHPNVLITKSEAVEIHSLFKNHMIGRVKAKNGFIIGLTKTFPNLTYKNIYKAAHGSYNGMV